MRRILTVLLAWLLIPVASAQSMTPEFVGSSLLVLAVIVGLASAAIIMYNALRMQGELQAVLAFFGAGLTLIVIGFISVVIPPWASASTIQMVHDLSFLLGCGLMGYAGVKQYRFQHFLHAKIQGFSRKSSEKLSKEEKQRIGMKGQKKS